MSSCLAEFCIGESGSLWARRHGLGGRILSSSKLQLAVCSGDEVDISFRHINLKQPHSNSTVHTIQTDGHQLNILHSASGLQWIHKDEEFHGLFRKRSIETEKKNCGD